MKTIVGTALLLVVYILILSPSTSQGKQTKKCYKVYNKAKNSCRKSLRGRYTIDDCCNNQGGQAHGERKKGVKGVINCTPCNTAPIEENWSDWGVWPTKCPVICGKGTIQVRRRCTDLHNKGCRGPSVKRKECVSKDKPNCPIHGAWSKWGNWSVCSTSCGKGKQLRFRSCSNPKPQYGGKACYGARESPRDCPNLPHCPIHGGWGEWGPWSACSVTCEIGRRQRTRKCDNPKPMYNGTKCNPPEAIFKQSCDTYRSCRKVKISCSGSDSGTGSGSGSGSGSGCETVSGGNENGSASGSGDTTSGSGDTTSGSGDSSSRDKRKPAVKGESDNGEDFDFGQNDAGPKKNVTKKP